MKTVVLKRLLGACGVLPFLMGCANPLAEPSVTTTTTVIVPASSTPVAASSSASRASSAVTPRGATGSSATGSQSASRDAASSSAGVGTDIAAAFKQLQSQVNGQIGVAFVPVHSSQSPSTLGSYQSDVAWSTSKVPVAVAAFRASDSAATAANAAAAIEQSDNSAAEGLWATLGSNVQASAATEKILAEGGNPGVSVPTVRLRAGYTVFGQTQWSLGQQATFVSNLSCLKQGPRVLNLMGQVTADQRWGLGRLNAQFKGGWGPDSSGSYIARQLGVVHLSTGDLAVAIMARPNSGSFAAATAELDQIAAWIPQHLVGQPTAACP